MVAGLPDTKSAKIVPHMVVWDVRMDMSGTAITALAQKASTRCGNAQAAKSSFVGAVGG